MKKDKLYTVSKYSADRINKEAKANLFYPGGFLLNDPQILEIYKKINGNSYSFPNYNYGLLSGPDYTYNFQTAQNIGNIAPYNSQTNYLGSYGVSNLDLGTSPYKAPAFLNPTTDSGFKEDLSKWQQNNPMGGQQMPAGNGWMALAQAAPGIAMGVGAAFKKNPEYSADAAGNGFGIVDKFLARGNKSQIGMGGVNVGASLMNSGLKNGNAGLILAGGIAGTVGTTINAGWGINENEKNIKTLTENNARLQATGRQLASATTSDSFIQAAANMGNGTGFRGKDLVTGGYFAGNKAAREANKYLNAEKQALAYQGHAMAQGAQNVDKIQDDNVKANFAADGGWLNYGDMGALEYGLALDAINARKRNAEIKDRIPNNPFGALAVAPNMFEEGGPEGSIRRRLFRGWGNAFTDLGKGIGSLFTGGNPGGGTFGGGSFSGAGDGGDWGVEDNYSPRTNTFRGLALPVKKRTFNDAYAEARLNGEKTFEFNGKTYSTEYDTSNDPERAKKHKKAGDERKEYGLVGIGKWDHAYGGPLMYEDGGILIKHPGRLTELKKRTGKTEAELWAEGKPDVRKMITFARNARKWQKAYGGFLDAADNLFALGGDVQMHGGDYTTGSTHIDEGGTHEENPYQGVQVGVDPEGTPNLVEEGEIIYNDYVYSQRIELDDEAKEKFHFSKKRDITYADAAKKLEKEISERPNDPLSRAAFKSQMQDLAEEQERQKAEMQAEEAREQFESLSPEEQVAVMQNAEAQEQQAAKEEAMMQEQAAQEQAMQEQAAMQGQPTEEQMMQEQMMAQQQGMMPQQPMGIEAQMGGYAYGGLMGNQYGMGGNLFLAGGPEDESDLARIFNEASKDDRSILQKVFGVNEVTKFLSNPIGYLAGDKINALIDKLSKFAEPQLEKFFRTKTGQIVADAIDKAGAAAEFLSVNDNSIKGIAPVGSRVGRNATKVINTARKAKQQFSQTRQVAKSQIRQTPRSSSTPSVNTGRNYVGEQATQASKNAARTVDQWAANTTAPKPVNVKAHVGAVESTPIGEQMAIAGANDAARARSMEVTAKGLKGNKLNVDLVEGSPTLVGETPIVLSNLNKGKWAAGLTGAGILTGIGVAGYNSADKTGVVDAAVNATDQYLNGKIYTAEQFYDQIGSGRKENRDAIVRMMKQVAAKRGLSSNLRGSDWGAIYYPLMDSLKRKGVIDGNGNIKANTKKAQTAAVQSTSMQSTSSATSKPQSSRRELSTADRNKIGAFNSRMRKEFGNGWASRFGLNKNDVQELYQGYIDGNINLDNLVKETRAGLQQNTPAANNTLIATPETPQDTYIQGYPSAAGNTGNYAPTNYGTASGGYYQASPAAQPAMPNMPPVIQVDYGGQPLYINTATGTVMSPEQVAAVQQQAATSAQSAQPIEQPAAIAPYDENTIRNSILNAVGSNTWSDFVDWAKKNNIADEDFLNTHTADTIDWEELINNENLRNALKEKNPYLADALSRGYDYGKLRPSLDDAVTFKTINRGNWKSQDYAGWNGSEDPAWLEAVERGLVKEGMNSKQIGEALKQTKAFQRGTQWLQSSEDNRLRYLITLLNDEGTPEVAKRYARKFINENGWLEGANRDYASIFGSNGVGVRETNPGTYWHTPTEATADDKVLNLVRNNKGEWDEIIGDIPTDWKRKANYSWRTVGNKDSDAAYINNVVNYYETPEQIAAAAEQAKANAKTGDAAKEEEPDRDVVPVLKSEWPRYAGLFGPAVGLGMMAAGIGKPNLKDYEAALEIANGGASLASYMPIGNYLKYQPMDIWAQQNRMDANSRATDMAILNNASPVGTRNAGLLANSYNSQLGSGELYRNALQYNDQLMQNVGTFNRATDMFNAEAFNRASATNAEIRNRDRQLRAQIGLQTAAEKAAANAGWYNSLYGNVAGLFKGFSDLGRENAQRNMIAKLAASGAFGTLTPENAVGAGLVEWADEANKKKKRNWLSIFD